MSSKENNGCLDCVHYKTEIDFWNNKPTKRICLKGNAETTVKWWEENGKKTRKDVLDSLECFEETQNAKFLNSMSNKIDEMMNILNENN